MEEITPNKPVEEVQPLQLETATPKPSTPPARPLETPTPVEQKPKKIKKSERIVPERTSPRGADEPMPLSVRDYWPRYHRRVVLMAIGMQLLVTLAIGWALIAAGVLEDGIVLLIVMIATFAGTTGVNLILVWLIASPLYDLSTALAHVAGEPTAAPPPNPNIVRYQSDGFSELLKTIYSLASKGPDDVPVHTADVSAVLKGLAQTKAGVVVLDHKQKIIYANAAAPIQVDASNLPHLELLFDKDDSLEDWIHKCEQSSVHASNTWQRISNKIVGENDRRIFDISANYEKGSEAETVLIFYDLTGIYKPEDDELDFISFAAHELRGPITVIRGYLDVFGDELNDKMDAEQRELLSRLVVSANRLSGYVNNILNASRYDRRHLKVHLIEDTMANVYDTIADDMQLRASSQNRFLSVLFPPDLPTIASDRASLSEVLGNLIDNAIKYSNEGEVGS